MKSLPLKNRFIYLSFIGLSLLLTNSFVHSEPHLVNDKTQILNNYINEAYTLVGLTIIYKHIFGFGNVNLKFGVENLFNIRYNGSIVPNAFGNNFYEPGSDKAFFAALNFTL